MNPPVRAEPQSAKPLALTMGDPAGIGLDITLQAWLLRAEYSLPPFVLFASPEAVKARAGSLDLDIPIAPVAALSEGSALFQQRLPIWPIAMSTDPDPGQPTIDTASAVIASIEASVDAAATGHAAAVVTNPIAKSVLYEAGFTFPGHTEFLAALAERHWPSEGKLRSVMMLAGPDLRVVPVTVHIPLSEVPQRLNAALIIETIRITADALRRDFAIPHPRLAVTGLNPHAGEGGALGSEDGAIIAPAIAAARAAGLNVSGPHPADTLFHAAKRATYDAVIAMYHDQALIPLKTIAFDEGVNVTLGLPFVRTSPDHGTAFDIAGTGKANAASLIAALRLARDMAAKRQFVAA